jgi:hypothetical protein
MFFLSNTFHSVEHCYNNFSWCKWWHLWSSCAPSSSKTQFFTGRNLLVYPFVLCIVATGRLSNQVGFDAILVWLIGHLYIENELAFRSNHAPVSHIQVHRAWCNLLSYAKSCWNILYSQGEYCNTATFFSQCLCPTNTVGVHKESIPVCCPVLFICWLVLPHVSAWINSPSSGRLV